MAWPEKHEYDHAQRVTISVSRWTGKVSILAADGTTHEFVFSADSGDTYGDGIYFATGEEYAEHVARGGW